MTETRNADYYRSLANDYLNGNKTLDDLIENCSLGYSARMVARVLTKCLLTDHGQTTREKAEMALREFAKNHMAPVAEEIVRRIVYTVSKAEENGREWNKENLDFLFQLLDLEELNVISWYTMKYAKKFNWKSNPQNEDNYEMLDRKLRMPGASAMCRYIVTRAKRKEEIEHLEEIAGGSEYYHKDDPSTRNNMSMPTNVLYAYLNMLANTALRERDTELVRAYAHFREFVYFALTNAGTSVCKGRMEREYFFEVAEALFENTVKGRVLDVLFKGIKKGGKEKRELHAEALKKLIQKGENAFIRYYETISEVVRKEMVEEFIRKNAAQRIVDVLEFRRRQLETFKNTDRLKRKT